jgi:hypothetical protein
LVVVISVCHGATAFDFEDTNAATTTGTLLPTQVTVQNAYWETEDEFGAPLAVPGFRPDVSSTVLLGDPSVAGYGPAISGNALDGTNSPVMFTFGSALNLSNFGVILDNSSIGNIPTSGGDPAFGTNILFYDSVDNLIGFILLDETVPGFTVSDAPGSFLNVSKVILPAGAFYDHLSFNAEAVPEPTVVGLACLGGLALLKRRRG